MQSKFVEYNYFGISNRNLFRYFGYQKPICHELKFNPVKIWMYTIIYYKFKKQNGGEKLTVNNKNKNI